MYPITEPQIIDLVKSTVSHAATNFPLILIGLGVGLGVLGVGVVVIWSAVESWRLREAKKPIVVR